MPFWGDTLAVIPVMLWGDRYRLLLAAWPTPSRSRGGGAFARMAYCALDDEACQHRAVDGQAMKDGAVDVHARSR